MKLINKKNHSIIEHITALEIISDNITYTLYENHQNMGLILKNSRIYSIDDDNAKFLLIEIDLGVALFEDNILYYTVLNLSA
jgi:hypothetical protein